MEKEKTVEFDKTTFRVTECPRCHNKDFSIDAEYCKICGLSLVNRCVLEQIGGTTENPSMLHNMQTSLTQDTANVVAKRQFFCTRVY